MISTEQLSLFENRKLIISLYDFTEAWPSEYIKAGYPVICWDYKIEGCILQCFDRLLSRIDDAVEAGLIPWGILSAPPCTDFSKAGASVWKNKDKTSAGEPYEPWTKTEYACALVEIILHLVTLYPWKWWVIENPEGRLERLVPEIAFFRKMSFNPCDYGDAYNKKTVLWGEFNPNLRFSRVEPETFRIKCGGGRWYNGSFLWKKAGGKSEKTKALRSATPPGFAKAFFEANN